MQPGRAAGSWGGEAPGGKTNLVFEAEGLKGGCVSHIGCLAAVDVAGHGAEELAGKRSPARLRSPHPPTLEQARGRQWGAAGPWARRWTGGRASHAPREAGDPGGRASGGGGAPLAAPKGLRTWAAALGPAPPPGRESRAGSRPPPPPSAAAAPRAATRAPARRRPGRHVSVVSRERGWERARGLPPARAPPGREMPAGVGGRPCAAPEPHGGAAAGTAARPAAGLEGSRAAAPRLVARGAQTPRPPASGPPSSPPGGICLLPSRPDPLLFLGFSLTNGVGVRAEASGSSCPLFFPPTISLLDSPSPGKRNLYKSVCLALALLVAVTVFQRSLTPGQFLQEPPPPTLEPPKAQKLNGHLVNSNNFWKSPKDARTPNPMVFQGPQAWDVTTTNCTANVNLTQQSWFQSLEPHFRQFLTYRHCRYFPMLLNHPEKCKGDVYMLVIIKSVITQHDRREAIRQTWGREWESAGSGRGAVRTLFLLGTASKQEERAHYQQLLAYEDRLYGDILQWDFLDSFFNLTLKEIHFLKWLDIYCPNVPFIFKGDDDVFVNPTNLLEFLADQQPQENLFVGDVLQHARPIRRKDNKYYIPTVLYSKTSYPPYAGGGGFLMAGGLARRLHHACDTLELYPIDDVFLGMCLEVLGVRPTPHEGFKTFGISRNRSSRMNKEPCFFRSMLVVHKLLPAELLAMWGLVHGNLTCSRKLQVL
ncbi:UDP-GlcNAc:betaGal beta-1,3-N-acetylglucosaminyltransferase 7 [Ctenodactylus gundi]